MTHVSSFNVTRFSFIGGRAKPVEQTLHLEGMNKYGTRHVVFSANVEGKDKPAHLFNLNIEDVKGLVEVLKLAIADAKEAPDTTPEEYKARMAARKAREASKKSTASITSGTDVQSLVAALQAAGFQITPPAKSTVELQDDLDVTPKASPKSKASVSPRKLKSAVQRGATHKAPVKPSEVPSSPSVDDLESIPTSDLEAVHSIMSILLTARGTK